MPTPRSTLLAALLVLLPLIGACASVPPGETTSPAGLALEVTNQSASDVVVYLAQGGTPVRLGRVDAMGKVRLTIPRFAGADRLIQILLRTTSGETHTPQSVWAAAGEVVQLTVRSLLSTSDLVVTPGEA